MKKIYKRYSEIYVKIDEKWKKIYCRDQYFYGEYFTREETVYDNEKGFDFLSKKFSHRENLIKKRKYINLWDEIIYKKDIQEVRTYLYCIEVQDGLSMEILKNILPYNEYIELVYNEWNKLIKKESKNVDSN